MYTGGGNGLRKHLERTWQRLVERGIVSSVQFVHDHFPHRVASAGTVLGVTVALVRHSEEQGVRPDGHSAQRGGDGRVVHEELVLHHLELLVAADSQVRRSDADDRTVGNVGESVCEEKNNQSFVLNQINGLAPAARCAGVTRDLTVYSDEIIYLLFFKFNCRWLFYRMVVIFSNIFVTLKIHYCGKL